MATYGTLRVAEGLTYAPCRYVRFTETANLTDGDVVLVPSPSGGMPMKRVAARIGGDLYLFYPHNLRKAGSRTGGGTLRVIGSVYGPTFDDMVRQAAKAGTGGKARTVRMDAATPREAGRAPKAAKAAKAPKAAERQEWAPAFEAAAPAKAAAPKAPKAAAPQDLRDVLARCAALDAEAAATRARVLEALAR